jgi:hypothetical protein
MRRLLLVLIGLFAWSGSAAAQLGVEEGPYDDYGSDQGPRRSGGVRISGQAREQLIPHTYTVQRGDTLWDVTGRFYGNPYEWPRVWSYNPEITNPHWIYPQSELRLATGDGGEPDIVEPGGNYPASNYPGGNGNNQGPRGRGRGGNGPVYLRQEGYLDQDALNQTGVIVGSPEDHMLLAPYDSVYVQFDENMRGTPRGEYTVYREMAPNERGPGEEGTLVRIFGTVRIDSYDRSRRTARATITEALDPIERGYRVAVMPRRFDVVPAQAGSRTISTHVAATLRPRELLGEEQVVFLPVGRDEGVRMGNRFFILHAGDTWREQLPTAPTTSGASVDSPNEPDQLPAEVAAEGRVVNVRPHSSTLLITRSVREVHIGDRAEMRQGY